VPLLVLALRRGSGQLFWVPRPNLTGALQVGEAIFSAGLEPSFRRTSSTIALLVLTGALLILFTVVVLVRYARGERSWPRVLVVSWLLVPLALVLVESAIGQSIFLPRNLLMTVPAASLLLAVGIFDRRAPAALSWVALAVLLVLRAIQLAPSYGVSPENWRAASDYVRARTEPADCIAFYPADGRMAFAYYLGTGAAGPVSILPAVPWSQVKPYVEDYATIPSPELSELPSRCPRLWLVSSHEGQASGPATSRANLARFDALRTALEREYRTVARASFGYASPVNVELLAKRP
jgi:hypothetical protein